MRKSILLCFLALWALPASAGKPQEAYFVRVDRSTMTFSSAEFHGPGARATSTVLGISGLPARISLPKRPQGTAASAAGRRTYEPIVIRKRIDKSSPLIAKALAGNRTLSRVVLHGRHTPTRRPVILTLHGVKIKSQQRLGGSSAAGDRPTEEVAFYYNKIAAAYARTTDGRD